MAKIDKKFNKVVEKVLNKGVRYLDKSRDAYRLQIPSFTLRHSFEDGFPAITVKELNMHSVTGELLWFLSGDNDIEYLNRNKVRIWNKDAYNWYVKKGGRKTYKEFVAEGKGSVGRNYSVQWRDYNGKVDQIKDLIEGMKENIMSTRLIVNAWNPSELKDTALPPCHDKFQIVGVPLENGEFGFELHWSQRSVDLFLGLPFNIASYASLAKFLEDITGYRALGIEGNLKCVHLYENAIEEARVLLSRSTKRFKSCGYSMPSLKGMKDLDFKKFDIKKFKLIGYEAYEPLIVPMLAPKKI